MWPFEQIDRLERIEALDRVGGLVKPVLEKLLTDRRVTDVLHGRWLGHPLHPVLVQVPVGTWTSAAILDARPGHDPAAAVLIGAGLVGSVPAIAAGWADWSQQDAQQQRTGLVHAAGNVVAVWLYGGSLLARAGGRPRLGKTLGYAGFLAASTAAMIGGHLAYRQAGGPSHAVAHAEVAPSGWHDVGALADLPDGRPVLRRLGGTDVFVLRRGEDVVAMVDRCSHSSGPLHEGELTVEDGLTCVTCPWHGSVFRVDDGSVAHGPATAPQPALDVRIEGGRLLVRLPGLSMG